MTNVPYGCLGGFLPPHVSPESTEELLGACSETRFPTVIHDPGNSFRKTQFLSKP